MGSVYSDRDSRYNCDPSNHRDQNNLPEEHREESWYEAQRE